MDLIKDELVPGKGEETRGGYIGYFENRRGCHIMCGLLVKKRRMVKNRNKWIRKRAGGMMTLIDASFSCYLQI